MADGPTRAQRALVLGALALLLLGGLREVEAWPVTGWRLFSAERGPVQAGWALQTVDEAGDARALSLGQLPVGYRMATWHLADAAADPDGEGAAVCGRLLAAAQDVRPGTTGLRILRDRASLVRVDGDWARKHVAAPALACGDAEG